MKIAMVSVLEGRGERIVVPFLKEHYKFEDGPGEIQPAIVDYEVVGGYLAHIRMPDKNTQSGVPYVLQPKIDILDYSAPLHSENLVFYPGTVQGWRKTLHFIGEEDKALKEHFCMSDYIRDLEYALIHWFPDFDIP